MNERIKELVEKSYIYDRQNDSSFFNKELFAQLIVQECCKIMGDHPDRPAGVIKRNVKEHFGVEE